MNKIKVLFSLWCIVFSACSSHKKGGADGVERIRVDVHSPTSDLSSFVEKMEIVPLETTDSSLLHHFDKLVYNKEMDMFAITTRDQTVFTFSGDGSFIGSSARMQGEAPNQYYMALDMQFNSEMKGIDILSPGGTVYTYSPTFDFLSKKAVKFEFPVDHFMPLGGDNYVFTYPFLYTDQEVAFANMKTGQVTHTHYEGTVSGNGMGRDCFYKLGHDFYFVPIDLNYSFYRIHPETKKLSRVMYLDFGDAAISGDALPGTATGKRTDSEEERSKLSQSCLERRDFVKQSNDFVPYIKLLSEDYVYVHVRKGKVGYGGHFVFNRKTKSQFFLWDDKRLLMAPCLAITGDVLLAYCPIDQLSEVARRDLMTDDEWRKMEQLNEDDNPVILKYYLKK